MTRTFLISIYGLTALAGVMLAFAEEIAFPTGLTLPVAILAWHFNEQTKQLRIQTFWANLLGVGAFLISGAELVIAGFSEIGFAAEGRLLAGAHLLTYLTWIALFQDKQGRQYWWMLALSLMQVAVGAILSQSSGFGLLLIIYVFLGLWTLSVFSLYQARFGFEQAGQSAADWVLVEVTTGSSLAASIGGLPHRQPDEARAAIQLDPNEDWINYRFVLGIVSTSLLSIAVGATFFTLIPRLWVGKQYDFNDLRGAMSKVTGFTNEVQLGEIGQILESNERVLEVRFHKADSLKELDVAETAFELGYDEPLFRGSVMGQYEKGRWNILKQSEDVTELFPPRNPGRLIRQQYIVHDGSSRTLFGMHPVFAAEFREGELLRPSMDVVTSILFRSDKDRSDDLKLEYVLFGAVPRRPEDRPLVVSVRSAPARRAQQAAMQDLLELPEGLERLRQLAQETAESVSPFDASEQPLDMRIAKAIEYRLGSSGEYTYSLAAEIVDPTTDPVEDFLFNRKQGHCEYSATAMALMLRAVGIPSRLISGFKGGEKNGLSGAFVVEGRHAHAWVEGYVNGRWRTFDPTPAARAESVAEIGESRGAITSFKDLLSSFWDQRIVRLSIDEQRQRVYAPLGNWLKQKASSLTRAFGFSGETIGEFISDPSRWFSVEMFIVTAVFMFILVGVRFLWRKYGPKNGGFVRWVFRQLRLLRLRLFASEQRIRIEFYERFLKILARHGLKRRQSQTPLEFASESDAALKGLLHSTEMSGVSTELAMKFYRVRFGGTPLTSSELSSIDLLLDQLSDSLKRRQTGRI